MYDYVDKSKKYAKISLLSVFVRGGFNENHTVKACQPLQAKKIDGVVMLDRCTYVSPVFHFNENDHKSGDTG